MELTNSGMKKRTRGGYLGDRDGNSERSAGDLVGPSSRSLFPNKFDKLTHMRETHIGTLEFVAK